LIGGYAVHNQLSSSKFVVETGDGLLAICKIFPRRSQGFFTELALARNLIHASLLEAEEVQVESTVDYQDGRSEACSCIIYSNFEGAEELEAKVRREGSISEQMTRQILNELVCVISYLHSNGLAHMDIQPANILVSPRGRIKLCDFDLVHHIEIAVP
jgi:serine/threonine protein kinase